MKEVIRNSCLAWMMFGAVMQGKSKRTKGKKIGAKKGQIRKPVMSKQEERQGDTSVQRKSQKMDDVA